MSSSGWKKKAARISRPLKAPHGTIEFRHVSFHYKGLPDVLHDLSFTIRKGETIAFVGETGSGKTTLLSLLLRFYDPTKGHIYLDGKDVADYSRDSIRRAIAFVSQDVFLFPEPLRKYCLWEPFCWYGGRSKSGRKAHAASFIGRFPQSYDTAVGQRGVRLSGGQRQRIALARAFLRASPILILDEATSALDNVTEAQVQRAMESLQRGRTTLIVAHRLSTIRHADRIFVMKRGRIAEEGTLENLIEKKGLFGNFGQRNRTSRSQSGGTVPVSILERRDETMQPFASGLSYLFAEAGSCTLLVCSVAAVTVGINRYLFFKKKDSGKVLRKILYPR